MSPSGPLLWKKICSIILWNGAVMYYVFFIIISLFILFTDWVLHPSLVKILIGSIIEYLSSKRRWWIKEPTCKIRESFNIFLSPILQPRVNNLLFSYHFTTFEILIKNAHYFCLYHFLSISSYTEPQIIAVL